MIIILLLNGAALARLEMMGQVFLIDRPDLVNVHIVWLDGHLIDHLLCKRQSKQVRPGLICPKSVSEIHKVAGNSAVKILTSYHGFETDSSTFFKYAFKKRS